MNLTQLTYFCDTAKNENLSNTAQNHGVPASAVSSSIKKLEEELGVSLFDRTPNKIKLNENGKIFASEIDFAFKRVNGAIEKITRTEKSKTEIKILCRARPKWIAEIIAEFLNQNPYVNIIFSNDYSLKNFEDFDLIIDELSNKYDGWQNFLLSTEIICVKASKNSNLIGKQLCFCDLEKEPFVLPSVGNGMRERYEKLCKQNGISPNVIFECNDRQILQYFVQSGTALTIGAYRALADNTQDEILPLNVTDFNQVQNVFAIFRDKNNPTLKNLCNLLYEKRYLI